MTELEFHRWAKREDEEEEKEEERKTFEMLKFWLQSIQLISKHLDDTAIIMFNHNLDYFIGG